MPTERVILKVSAEKAGDRPGLFFGFFLSTACYTRRIIDLDD
jgi:hypothetical protein